MNHRLTISIAGFDFLVHLPADFQPDALPESYTEFAGPGKAPGRDGIRVEVSVDPPPDWDGIPLVFDNGVSWRMHVTNDPIKRHLVFYRTRAPREWLFGAVVAGDLSRIMVYCSQRIVERTADGLRIYNPVRYPLDQLVLMYGLARRKGLILHAAGLVREAKAFVFPGPSGAGKSTLMRNLEGLPGSVALSDDRIIVRDTPQGFFAFGTPWPGEGGIAVNQSGRLEGIYVLSQDDENRLEPASRGQALKRLLPAVSVPWYEPKESSAILDTLDELIARVPVFDLHFTPDERVADLLADLA